MLTNCKESNSETDEWILKGKVLLTGHSRKHWASSLAFISLPNPTQPSQKNTWRSGLREGAKRSLPDVSGLQLLAFVTMGQVDEVWLVQEHQQRPLLLHKRREKWSSTWLGVALLSTLRWPWLCKEVLREAKAWIAFAILLLQRHPGSNLGLWRESISLNKTKQNTKLWPLPSGALFPLSTYNQLYLWLLLISLQQCQLLSNIPQEGIHFCFSTLLFFFQNTQLKRLCTWESNVNRFTQMFQNRSNGMH